MCTGLSMNGSRHYFGRNLDLEYDFGQQVVITPRNMPLKFSDQPEIKEHCAIIGMGTVMQGYPLYADAINEHGLGMAGLHFALYADYPSRSGEGTKKVAPFEFIPWVLGQCRNLNEAEALLTGMELTDVPFSNEVPNSKLHWMLSDGTGSLIVEPLPDGLRIEKDSLGVLTNDPPYDFQMTNLNSYMNLTACPATNRFSPEIPLRSAGKGSGAFGLPGDSSPISRFVRIAFNKTNSVCDSNEEAEITQFFHLLDSVASIQGPVRTDENKFFITRYSSCMFDGRYIYKTYKNNQLTEIDMGKTDMDGDALTIYPLVETQQIKAGN